MRLSPAQEDVIAKMKAGWELGRDRGYTGRLWLHEGGLDSGGRRVTIQHGTFNFLARNKIIERVCTKWPWTRYALVGE
jgi:hypothetical protein